MVDRSQMMTSHSKEVGKWGRRDKGNAELEPQT
jgi:hypothetical protein